MIRAHVHSENGTVWLVGADVCKALQITNPSYVASKLDKANVKHHYLINSQGKKLVTWYASIQADYVLIPRETMLKLFDILEKMRSFI